MKSSFTRKTVVSLVSAFFVFVIAACGSGIEGTYANDTVGIVLELRSGGKATFTSSLGDNDTCSYKVDGNKLTLDCKHDKVVFVVHDDGSLTAPFFGTLRKSKK